MPRLVVFKGGTAFNTFLPEFHQTFPNTSYVIPVSDDGGSSREIVRVFGGPGIGDIRSTLTRLSDPTSNESLAVKAILEFRLNPHDSKIASLEWHAILEGTHSLWKTMTPKFKGLIHGFLRHFEAERLKAINMKFDLRNGSIGNFFFTGARLFFGSLETPVFIYSSVSSISQGTRVLPVIESNDPISIGARLMTQDVLIGQSVISHPKQGPVVSKEGCYPLPGRIERIFYTNKYGDRITPEINPEVMRSIEEADGIIYGIGSFWTSILPSLIFPRLGEAIAKKRIPKVFMLNSFTDRETGGMTAYDSLKSLTNALNGFGKERYQIGDFVSHLSTVKGSSYIVETDELKKQGVQVCTVEKDLHSIIFEGKSYSRYKFPSLKKLFESLF